MRTLHGDIEVARAYYRCDHCGQTFIPWDGEQGLDERLWTPKVKELVASAVWVREGGRTSSNSRRSCLRASRLSTIGMRVSNEFGRIERAARAA